MREFDIQAYKRKSHINPQQKTKVTIISHAIRNPQPVIFETIVIDYGVPVLALIALPVTGLVLQTVLQRVFEHQHFLDHIMGVVESVPFGVIVLVQKQTCGLFGIRVWHGRGTSVHVLAEKFALVVGVLVETYYEVVKFINAIASGN